jgi:hypothetical protein
VKKNQMAFEGYLKQAVEDVLGYKVTDRDFTSARGYADKASANSMQRRIELIASFCRR